MATQQYHNLRDVSPGTYHWNIKARIIRLWRGVSAKGEEFKGLNILLLDDKQHRIHAFVPGLVIEKHESKLVLGNICTFYNFSVKPYRNDEKFRCIESDRQIIVTNYTEINNTDSDDMLIPKNVFNFYDLTDLDKIANNNLYLTDVIGVIWRDTPLSHLVNRFGQPQVQVKFTIVDGRCSANVTLWDSLAEQFDQAYQEITEYPSIIIIASAKITSWQRTDQTTPIIDISNAAATKFYLNYDHHSVSQLRRMLTLPLFAKYEFPAQIPNKIEYLSVEEIKKLGKQYIEREVICQVKITEVCEKLDWYYYICTSCYNQIEYVNASWKCFVCDHNVPYADMKMRFEIEAEDHSGSIDITLDDREARTVILKNAYDIIEEGKYMNKFPPILKMIENKNYNIKLQISSFNVEKKGILYLATGIHETIQELSPVVDMSTTTSSMHESISQASGSSYHLDDFSQLNFQTPDLQKKKRTLRLKKS